MSGFTPVEKSLCLHKVCEANYRRLARLAPDLLQLRGAATARVAGKPALHLRVIERSPFTLVLELTHDFAGGQVVNLEPAVRIRVCLDARTAEMLCDAARPLVHDALPGFAAPAAVLDYKWSLNYFLSRWLDHCIAGQYRFGMTSRERQDMLLSA